MNCALVLVVLYSQIYSGGSQIARVGRVLNVSDHSMPPTFEKGSATVVSANMYIVSFDSISSSTMDFKLMMYLRLQWNDQRLSFQHEDKAEVHISANNAKQFWFPDIFFVNEEGGKLHVLLQPNQSWKVSKNGTVLTSTRISLTLGCDMNLRNFPLDTQVCRIEMESYSFPVSVLSLYWRENKAISIRPGLEIPQYDLVRYYPQKYVESYGLMGVLKIKKPLEHNYHYSWVSFWISFESVPARITLGLLTILTMTTLSSGVNSTLPKVSYVKCIDVWLSVCLSLVFAALIEFAIVNTFWRRKKIQPMTPAASTNEHEMASPNGDVTGDDGENVVLEQDFLKIAEKMDMISRGLFPLLFVIFNIYFWIYYMTEYRKDPEVAKNIEVME